MLLWKVFIHAEDRRRLDRLASILPCDSDVTVFAKPDMRLRIGLNFFGKPVKYVNDPARELSHVQPSPDMLVMAFPIWSSPSQALFNNPFISAGKYACAIIHVTDPHGNIVEPTSSWAGASVLGIGGEVVFYEHELISSSASESVMSAINIGGPEIVEACSAVCATRDKTLTRRRQNASLDIVEPSKRRTKVIDQEAITEIALMRSIDVKRIPWRYTQEVDLLDESHNDIAVRDLKAHWIAIHFGNSAWNWRTVCETLFPRSDRDIVVFPGLAMVSPGAVRRMPPISSITEDWIGRVRDLGFRISICDASGSIMFESGEPDHVQKNGKKLKVAVLSMCGVTSFTDRYGIGGEHQVVHWLKEGFDASPEVEICDIYDTANLELAPDGLYDIILSNSCWEKPPVTAHGGTTIFWHFNTNANRCNEFTVTSMGYDVIWTNSPSSLVSFRKSGAKAFLKHLNASTLHHEPYLWESSLFHHDACYVGGYQTEYKGKGLIDSYVKSLCGHNDIDFAIYGNSKWKHEVQLKALETDHKYFKQEHVDPSFDAYYKHMLHPDDFRILAKNCKVWVNFNAEDQRPFGMCNDRPIWAMNAGAFIITDDTPEQRELYGDTCDYSTGGSDLVEKVKYWLPREKERRERGVAARENILRRNLHSHATARAAIEQHLFKNGPVD